MQSRAKCKAWLKETDGSVAVEFAQIAIPFIFMMIAIIELSLFFAAANMLEGGLNESARMIRIGALQQEVVRPQEEVFREAICSNVMVLIKCEDVDIEVVTMNDDSFSSTADLEPVYDEDGRLVERPFDAGGSDDVVMIRAAYRYQLMTPLFSRLFTKTADHTIPIMSTVILRTEPYDFNDDQENT